jgi:hypothetical protein
MQLLAAPRRIDYVYRNRWRRRRLVARGSAALGTFEAECVQPTGVRWLHARANEFEAMLSPFNDTETSASPIPCLVQKAEVLRRNRGAGNAVCRVSVW